MSVCVRQFGGGLREEEKETRKTFPSRHVLSQHTSDQYGLFVCFFGKLFSKVSLFRLLHSFFSFRHSFFLGC